MRLLLALLALAHWVAAQPNELCAGARSGVVAFYAISSRCADNATLLHEASFGGHVKVVKELLRLKASVDATDDFRQTPLAWAALKGHSAAAEILLKAEAKVDARDAFQCTALLDAAKGGGETLPLSTSLPPRRSLFTGVLYLVYYI